MRPHKGIRRLALVVGAVAALSAAWSVPKARAGYAPFVPQAPPQRALGDFDGDGRIDTAVIHDRAGDRRISVQLSGSSSAIHLEAAVSALIERDVDHDGDLDLVAATPNGDVLIWLNDGHGRFTRQAASNTGDVSGQPTMAQAAWPESIAIGVRAPLLPPPSSTETAVVVTQVRPRNLDIPADDRCPILPALRAPPAARS